ncbi:acyl carrier protein [Streptomyces cavernae]|uniref:acyl carrier protein n=1 Tax=Streptomyces cavernae TaxID=2259034 RepID=UPI000FEBC8B2|nr:acyl carrier protein [Streptomyces cavernae]
MTLSPPRHIEAPFHHWLTTHLAVYLDRLPETIDATVPLAEYGADSVCALSLCGDIEDDFGIVVEPSLLWDHPTVAQLAAHLTARGADPARGQR